MNGHVYPGSLRPAPDGVLRPGAPWPLSNVMTPLSALPSALSCVRAEVRAALTRWDMSNLTEAAELVVTELATNAVRAAGRSGQPSSGLGRPTPVILICLLADRVRLRIETWDQAPGFPVLRGAPVDAEFGRGLALVDAMTEGRWGWHPTLSAQVGKCVWAEIPVRDAPASPLLASAVPNRAATPGTN